MKIRISVLFKITFLFLTSCSHLSEKDKASYMNAFHEGKIEKAEAILDINRGSISYQKNKNALWFSLESGSLNFINNQMDRSIAYFKHALEASDYFLQEDTSEKIQKLLFSDEMSAFSGEDYEQILLRVYFAFALIQKGDLSNGLALLKQAESYSQLREAIYVQSRLTKNIKILPNPLAKYLLALFLEKEGDLSNAQILYKQAKSSLSDTDVLFPKNDSTNCGTLLFICHNGNSPYRTSVRDKVSEDALFMLNILLESDKSFQFNIPGSSSSMNNRAYDRNILTMIPKISVPKLERWPNSKPITSTVTVGDQKASLIPIYNIDTVAHEQLHQALPLITARAAARYLIREQAARITKSNAFNFGTLLTNILTNADTRSWMTLPYSFDIMRFDLKPGIYPITVEVNDPVKLKQYQLPKIKIDKNEICLVHLFNIHPNVFRYLVPSSFTLKENTDEKN